MNGPSPRRQPDWLARLAAGRRPLIGVALALVVLVLAGFVPLPAAAAIAVVLAVSLAVPGEDNRPQNQGSSADGARDEDLAAEALVAESLPDPCIILDAGGAALFVNARAEALLAVRPGDLLASRLRHPDLVAALERVRHGGGPQQVAFAERVPTERWFSAWFAPLGADDPPRRIVLVLDDLSAARAAERMRVDFVANASHELRTPLASLAGFIETLQGPARDDPAARQRFLAIMHEQAKRMSRLIDDLLSLSRIELKAHVRPRDPVDLVPLLRSVAVAMEPAARDNNVLIEVELPQGPVTVPGDRDELVQVFQNLVENACKYGASGGRVVIRMDAPAGAGAATVAVVDFGAGIAPEHLPRLTERFYRVDADDSRRHRGTGLGLAIVKHIVTRHRARLQIDSRPGEGARFAVTFPEATAAGGPGEDAGTVVG